MGSEIYFTFNIGKCCLWLSCFFWSIWVEVYEFVLIFWKSQLWVLLIISIFFFLICVLITISLILLTVLLLKGFNKVPEFSKHSEKWQILGHCCNCTEIARVQIMKSAIFLKNSSVLIDMDNLSRHYQSRGMVLFCLLPGSVSTGSCVGDRGLLPSLMHKPTTSSLGDSLTCCLLFWGGFESMDSTKHLDSSLAKPLPERFPKKSDFYLLCISMMQDQFLLCGSSYSTYFSIAIGSYPWL